MEQMRKLSQEVSTKPASDGAAEPRVKSAALIFRLSELSSELQAVLAELRQIRRHLNQSR